jgi:CTD small phosphatase-like protein 2
LDAIEGEKKYFSYVFYRDHTVIEDNDYVKDISRIGRDLSKTIIVDNMPQNFRLQKENGILIKTFYGEDQSDKSLLELIPILTEMAKTPGKDLRDALALFKDEILKKVSSNLSRNK